MKSLIFLFILCACGISENVFSQNWIWTRAAIDSGGAGSEGLSGRIGNMQADAQNTMYPNPFSKQATLHIDESTAIVNATLTIYDLNGKAVAKTSSINSNIILIEKGGLPDGMYFFQLTGKAGLICSGKFVINE